MPSLKKFREMTGLPDTVRRWKEAAEIVKDGQKSISDQEEVRALLQGPPSSPPDQEVKAAEPRYDMDSNAANVQEAVNKQEAPVTERPESIKREGLHYESVETMHQWYPETARHLDAVPLDNMLKALGLHSYTEDGTLWIQDIDKVSNGYYTFENPENAYDMYLIPMPEGWGVMRDHLPKGMQMDALVGNLEDVLKYDVHHRHIAPLTVILDLVERFKARPLTWNFTHESWLIPKSFRDREVGVPGLMESYEIRARKGGKRLHLSSCPTK